MKYYAVTDDPNELMHYGRLGMKWGQHIFSGTKSLAYKRAANKLSRRMRNGIASKVSHWRKQPTAAELRAKAKAKAAKQEARAYRKEQRFMNKAVQRAREGRLRYGKLTDDQVRRVTERLALERNARQLGSTEKPKFRTRMKEALQEGMLQGATRGGAAYIEERWRAKGKYAAQKKYGAKIAKQEARDQLRKNKILDRANEKKRDKEEAREEERAERLGRESYEYGAVFDNKGKLNYSNAKALSDYYKRKYIEGQSTTDDQKAKAKAEKREKQKYAKVTRKLDRAQRASERKSIREANTNEARLSAERARRLKAADETERARYRSGVAKLSAEAGRRDSDRAIASYVARRNAAAARSTEIANNLGNPSVDRKRKGINRPWVKVRRK